MKWRISMYKKIEHIEIIYRIKNMHIILYGRIFVIKKTKKKKNGRVLRDFNSKCSFFRRWPATRFERLLINDHQTHSRFVLCPVGKNSHNESNCIENVRFFFFFNTTINCSHGAKLSVGKEIWKIIIRDESFCFNLLNCIIVLFFFLLIRRYVYDFDKLQGNY